MISNYYQQKKLCSLNESNSTTSWYFSLRWSTNIHLKTNHSTSVRLSFSSRSIFHEEQRQSQICFRNRHLCRSSSNLLYQQLLHFFERCRFQLLPETLFTIDRYTDILNYSDSSCAFIQQSQIDYTFQNGILVKQSYNVVLEF